MFVGRNFVELFATYKLANNTEHQYETSYFVLWALCCISTGSFVSTFFRFSFLLLISSDMRTFGEMKVGFGKVGFSFEIGRITFCWCNIKSFSMTSKRWQQSKSPRWSQIFIISKKFYGFRKRVENVYTSLTSAWHYSFVSLHLFLISEVPIDPLSVLECPSFLQVKQLKNIPNQETNNS